MERKNITIREDQAEWVAENEVNLSQLVQQTIDDEMGPNEAALAQAYQDNAADAAETTTAWDTASAEANRHLGDPPREE